MNLDSIQKVKINIDAANGNTSKVVIVNNDTVADINIVKSDSTPGIVINGPKLDGRFFRESHLDVVSLFAVILFFAVPALMTWLLLRFFQKRNELRHRERMSAIERGVMLTHMEMNTGKNPYVWPLVLVGSGFAFIVINVFQLTFDSFSFGFGLIILMIGGALFAARYIRRKDLEKQIDLPIPPPPPAPPSIPE